MKNHKLKTLSVYAVATLFLASCASTSQKTAPDNNDAAASPTTLDSPLAPGGTAPTQISAIEETSPTIKALPSIIDKMEAHSRTLYWGTKDTYTYYHGGVLEAEYKPGEGITLREDKEENAIECRFNEAGNLAPSSAEAQLKAEIKKKCSQLMFTFDEQISE